ncbi:uncharacterized protein LOC34620072 [Cyclospora cayetanensis]|uniref:Uncharacterized protein LOC34620072 n=1 Tax=Cyclospora cayetanensis TaxID=88456 RepID=A0A6P6RRE8_9EIME|nr:uncharacterized protein LOC34620072 [Cyclospora cayetanensis]
MHGAVEHRISFAEGTRQALHSASYRRLPSSSNPAAPSAAAASAVLAADATGVTLPPTAFGPASPPLGVYSQPYSALYGLSREVRTYDPHSYPLTLSGVPLQRAWEGAKPSDGGPLQTLQSANGAFLTGTYQPAPSHPATSSSMHAAPPPQEELLRNSCHGATTTAAQTPSAEPQLSGGASSGGLQHWRNLSSASERSASTVTPPTSQQAEREGRWAEARPPLQPLPHPQACENPASPLLGAAADRDVRSTDWHPPGTPDGLQTQASSIGLGDRETAGSTEAMQMFMKAISGEKPQHLPHTPQPPQQRAAALPSFARTEELLSHSQTFGGARPAALLSPSERAAAGAAGRQGVGGGCGSTGNAASFRATGPVHRYDARRPRRASGLGWMCRGCAEHSFPQLCAMHKLTHSKALPAPVVDTCACVPKRGGCTHCTSAAAWHVNTCTGMEKSGLLALAASQKASHHKGKGNKGRKLKCSGVAVTCAQVARAAAEKRVYQQTEAELQTTRYFFCEAPIPPLLQRGPHRQSAHTAAAAMRSYRHAAKPQTGIDSVRKICQASSLGAGQLSDEEMRELMEEVLRNYCDAQRENDRLRREAEQLKGEFTSDKTVATVGAIGTALTFKLETLRLRLSGQQNGPLNGELQKLKQEVYSKDAVIGRWELFATTIDGLLSSRNAPHALLVRPSLSPGDEARGAANSLLLLCAVSGGKRTEGSCKSPQRWHPPVRAVQILSSNNPMPTKVSEEHTNATEGAATAKSVRQRIQEYNISKSSVDGAKPTDAKGK